jgi:PAS domain S-box-containing protein
MRKACVPLPISGRVYTPSIMRQRSVDIAVGAGIAVAYFAAAHLGFRMAFVAEQVTTVWPPTGIALAALVLRGGRMWPAVWIGALAANATAAPLWTAASIATGNTLEAVMATWALTRITAFDPVLRRIRDVGAFILIAAVGSSTIAATVGASSLCVSGLQPWARYWSLWSDWMLGDVLGALVVAPVFFTVLRAPVPARRMLVETVALVLGTLVVTTVVFGRPLTPMGHRPLEFIVFPFVIVAAVRVGQPATSLVVLVASAVTIWATGQGSGPFAEASLHRSLMLLQVFMGVLASSGLILAAAMTERRTAEQRRAAAHAVGQVLTTASALEDAAPRILEKICTHLEWQVGGLWMLDRHRDVLTCRYVWTREPAVAPFTVATQRTEFSPGIGLPGRVWSTGVPHWIEDVTRDTNFPRTLPARQANLHGGFGFPVRLGDDVLGVVEFFRRRVASRDPDLLATMSAVGVQIGQFIVRERAERAMRQSERETRAILETALDAFLAMDHRGIVLEFNAAAERTFGYRRQDVVGRVLADLLLPAVLRDPFRQELERYLTTGGGTFMGRRLETIALRADGSEFPVEVSITAVPTAGDPMFTGFVRDLTERVTAERERHQLLRSEREARRHAEEANRAKDEFLATLSHELRTPLNAIVGWTRMLLDGAVEEAHVRRTLQVIDRNAQAQVQLVADLLDVSRIITGGLRLDQRPVDLGSVIGASLDAIRPAADAKQIALRSRLPPGAVVTLGDAARLQQIVWNLLSNAVKFTPPGGRVHIALSDRDDRVQIEVSDTGTGIAPDFLPFVFDRFRQADGSSARRHGGLGLGLAIVRHLVELHGGSVRADSAGDGTGATFTVELPRVGIDRSHTPAGDVDDRLGHRGDCPRELRLAGCRVLVVDDEEDARHLMESVLVRSGAEIRAAGSVEDAWRCVQDAWPHILLTDLGMPGEDGFALIRRLRALERDGDRRIPAGAITAYSRNEDRQRALEAGFDLHLSKPAGPEAIVEAAVALWHLARAEV